MKTSRNLIAGLVNSAWTAIIGLAVIPLYLNLIGLESYGLIGFYTTLLSVLLLLDMGLAPTINREVARNLAEGNASRSSILLHSLAVIYGTVSLLIAFIVFLLAPYIAKYWINSNQLPLEVVEQAVMLIGIVIAARWPISLYQGAIIGVQKLTITSGINICMITLSSIGAVLVLMFISPSIQAFFIWQAAIGFLHTLVIRYAAKKVIGIKDANKFNWDVLKPIWRFSAGMGLVAITGAVLLQMDKIILSAMLSLTDFGGYTVASLLASSLLIILMPVYNTVYPKLSGLIASGENAKILELYRRGTRYLCSILFPLAMVIYIFSGDLIYLWTGNLELSVSVAPIVSFLVLGFALNGVMVFPYALQLAHGNYQIPLLITTTLIAVQLPAAVVLVDIYGALGAALSWLLLNVLYMLLGTYLTHSKYLLGWGYKWILQDVFLPLFISFIVIYVIFGVILNVHIENHFKLI